jgi:hypothetical protein
MTPLWRAEARDVAHEHVRWCQAQGMSARDVGDSLGFACWTFDWPGAIAAVEAEWLALPRHAPRRRGVVVGDAVFPRARPLDRDAA